MCEVKNVGQPDMNSKTAMKIEHLVKWYYGTFCVRCGRMDMENERHGKNCYDKLCELGDGIDVKQMTHKEFVAIVKSSSLCRPLKRDFKECPICKALGVPQRRW